MYEKVCKNCGKIFYAKKIETEFCCRECYNEYCKTTGYLKKGNANKIEVVCAECGKHEFVPASRARKYLCCSKECLGKYNSKKYNTQVEKECPICHTKFFVKQSQATKRVCCSIACSKKHRSLTKTGENNSNYKGLDTNLKDSIRANKRKSDVHTRIVKNYFGLKKSIHGYDIHHKDANHNNNELTNLIVIPRDVHMLIHRWFGNILIHALHTGIISRETFYSMCTEEQKQFYKEIIDLNITSQVVVKQGELLENPEEDNQQPSIYRNIIVGSETNSRVLIDSCAKDSNTDTSALPFNEGEDIVQTACITYEDADLLDKELIG